MPTTGSNTVYVQIFLETEPRGNNHLKIKIMQNLLLKILISETEFPTEGTCLDYFYPPFKKGTSHASFSRLSLIKLILVSNQPRLIAK